MKLLDLFCDNPAAPACEPGGPDVLPEAPVSATGYTRTEAYWHSVCPDYWRGCPTCPDGMVFYYGEAGQYPVTPAGRFCKRYPRTAEGSAPDTNACRSPLQGRLLQ